MSGRNRAKSGFIPLPATSSLYAGSAPTSKPKQTNFVRYFRFKGNILALTVAPEQITRLN
jgi:hypothetical protein